MFDRAAYDVQSRQTWNELAPGWEARHDWLVATGGVLTDRIVDRADPKPGQRFLDLAAGPGDLGFQVAERVGPDGRVISTDFAPGMVELARRIGEGRGLTNVDHRLLDAQRMDLDDDSVDGVVCRFGYMLMADPAAAIRESHRVLRDGGCLTFGVWTTPDRNSWAAVPAMTLVQRGHLSLPAPGEPGIFAMGDPDLIRDLVTGAGFAEPEIEEVTFDFVHPDFDDVWDALTRLAGPLAMAIAGLDDDELAATREAIRTNAEPYRQADGSYREPASAWLVHAC